MKNETGSLIRVLIVDDNEINLMMLVNMLDNYEMEVDCAANGKEAIRLCMEQNYDLIFIDHMMPYLDGLHTTKAIRDLPNGQLIMVIALSAEVTDELKSLYQSVGVEKVLKKPLESSDVSELMNIIHNNSFGSSKFKQETPVFSQKHLLEASLRDLQSGIDKIINGTENNLIKQQLAGTHILINVFGNLGESVLYNLTRKYEEFLSEGIVDASNHRYLEYISKIKEFQDKLYKSLINMTDQTQTDTDYCSMSNKEYEQCLINTIYYIRRYEYDSIIKELQHLIQSGRNEGKQELIHVLKDIEEFKYEEALIRLAEIIKKTGIIPVPDKDHMVDFNSFEF